MFAFPGVGGYSLLLIQKQDEDEKQCCQRRRILIIDELDITFNFKMILEGDHEIDEILGDSGGRFIKKPVHINELIRRVKSELLS
jgi:hypothetical protein